MGLKNQLLKNAKNSKILAKKAILDFSFIEMFKRIVWGPNFGLTLEILDHYDVGSMTV